MIEENQIEVKLTSDFSGITDAGIISSMSINRRDLIKLAALGLVIPSCLRKAPLSNEVTREVLYYGVGASDADPEGSIGAGSFDFLSESRLSLANEIHSITYSPELNLRVYLPKLGKVGYFQRGEKGELKSISPSSGKLFYGHGAFDIKRGVFYSTQSTVSSEYQRDQLFDKGEIHVHSLSDFSPISSFSSFGNNPHDLKIQGNKIIVCNGGDKSNVVFIDLDTKTLLKSYDLHQSPHISFGHLDLLPDGRLLVASGSRKKSLPCKLYSVSEENGLKAFDIPKGLEGFFLGQLLSVTHHENYAFATCPASSYVFAWNLQGQFLSALTMKNASSLAYSPIHKKVIVGSGNFKENLCGISENNGHFSLVEFPNTKIRTGSHATIVASR